MIYDNFEFNNQKKNLYQVQRLAVEMHGSFRVLWI